MGYKSVIGVGQCSNDTVDQAINNGGNGFTAYGPVGGPICTASWEGSAPKGTAASGLLNCHSPHTSSNMGLRLTGTSALLADINMYLSINGVQGNQLLKILSYANNGNQNYPTDTNRTDATHSDAIASGVTLSFAQGYTGTGLSGNAVFTSVFWEADQPGGASVPFAATVDQYNAYSGLSGGESARWIGPTGSMHVNNNAGQAQVSMPSAGTWSNFQMNVFGTLPADSASTFAYMKSYVSSTYSNGATRNVVLAVAGNVSAGVQDDATGTDAVPAGELICYQVSNGQANNLFYWSLGSTWTSAQPNVTPLISVDTPVTGVTSGTSNAQIGYMGVRPGAATPAEGPAPIPPAGTFSGLNVTFYAATTGSPTFTSNPNGAAGNQTGVIGSTAGVTADLSHTDALAAGSNFDNSFSGFTSSFSLASQAVAFTTPDGGGGMMLRGVG